MTGLDEAGPATTRSFVAYHPFTSRSSPQPSPAKRENSQDSTKAALWNANDGFEKPSREQSLFTDGRPKCPNGRKRTASGSVKSAGALSSHGNAAPNGHSHVSGQNKVFLLSYSMPSSTLTELQLSSQLRTRLSTAFSKVQHGWGQPQPVAEADRYMPVQRIPSASSAPNSPTARRGSHSNVERVNNRLNRDGSLQPPPSSIRHVRTLSDSAGVDLPSRHRSVETKYQPSQSNTPMSPPPSAAAATGTQQARTYESFWRNHNSSNNNPASRMFRAQVSQNPHPSLAPPVDIVSRRKGHNNSAPPLLSQVSPLQRGQGHWSPIHQRSSSNNQDELSWAQSTPSTIRPSSQPTSSSATAAAIGRDRGRATAVSQTQKAAMEQDAVETLLFMSSPGNSSYHLSTFRAPTPSPVLGMDEQVMHVPSLSREGDTVGVGAEPGDGHAKKPRQSYFNTTTKTNATANAAGANISTFNTHPRYHTTINNDDDDNSTEDDSDHHHHHQHFSDIQSHPHPQLHHLAKPTPPGKTTSTDTRARELAIEAMLDAMDVEMAEREGGSDDDEFDDVSDDDDDEAEGAEGYGVGSSDGYGASGKEMQDAKSMLVSANPMTTMSTTGNVHTDADADADADVDMDR
ncbi:MAG: hypothetical protein M1819_006386 [Sarea resinae]|nr:MAG: hypothetical protein M1819_006386 [Sarea resinae]